MELATLPASEVCPEMMAQEISLVGTGTARGLGHRHDTARVVQARPPSAGTAVAGLAIRPCGAAAEAAELATRLFAGAGAGAGAGTGMQKAAQVTVPGRKSHVWTAVLAIWSASASASAALATGLCRRLDTARAERGRLLGDGTAAAEVPERWLAGGTAAVVEALENTAVAGVLERHLSAGTAAVGEVLETRLLAGTAVEAALASHPASTAVVRATRLSRRGSGTAAAGASWCGRASRAC
jgi:hypothetical protein